MTSTRLPGKILKVLGARPMLAQQIRRLRACREIDEICIATTTNVTDDIVAQLVRNEDLPCFRGSEHDVLSRYVGAARQMRADVVIRLTADCPLCDPPTVDAVVLALTEQAATTDYASNVLKRTFPQGLDVEALWIDVLERAARIFASPEAREHVTAGIYAGRPDLFLLKNVENTRDDSDLSWTVDTPTDFEMARLVYKYLGLDERIAPLSEMLEFVRAHPEISRLNVCQKTWSPFENRKSLV
jgi:spore coat polysaccharide biosynthesis protein SpsF